MIERQGHARDAAADTHRRIDPVDVLVHRPDVARVAGAAVLRGRVAVVADREHPETEHIHHLVDERRLLTAVAFRANGD